MLILKIYLLSGLVIHKAIWEVLKRRNSPPYPFASKTTLKVQLIKGVKIAILLGLVVQIFLPDVFPISSSPLLLRVVGTLTYTAGLLLAIRGRTELGGNWSDIESAKISSSHRVVMNGPYKYVRHPIYTGDLLLLFGLELTLNSWLVLGVFLLAPIVLRQAIKEEQRLALTLPEYEHYCSQTKRFIPFVV